MVKVKVRVRLLVRVLVKISIRVRDMVLFKVKVRVFNSMRLIIDHLSGKITSSQYTKININEALESFEEALHLLNEERTTN